MTTGTYNFVSVMVTFVSVGALISGTGGLTLRSASFVAVSVITQSLDHVKIRFTSQWHIQHSPKITQMF